MPKLTVTTRTKEEIDALFTAVFKNVRPQPRVTPLTQEDRLAPYRKAILKQRRRGVSWVQIAAAMADPRIGERVSDKLLRRVFGAADLAHRSGQKQVVATNAPAYAATEARATRADRPAGAPAGARTEGATEAAADAARDAATDAPAEAATDVSLEGVPQ